jgi:hypothetical protein
MRARSAAARSRRVVERSSGSRSASAHGTRKPRTTLHAILEAACCAFYALAFCSLKAEAPGGLCRASETLSGPYSRAQLHGVRCHLEAGEQLDVALKSSFAGQLCTMCPLRRSELPPFLGEFNARSRFGSHAVCGISGRHARCLAARRGEIAARHSGGVATRGAPWRSRGGAARVGDAGGDRRTGRMRGALSAPRERHEARPLRLGPFGILL